VTRVLWAYFVKNEHFSKGLVLWGVKVQALVVRRGYSKTD